MGMDWRTVDTLGAGRWTLDAEQYGAVWEEMLLCCEAAGRGQSPRSLVPARRCSHAIDHPGVWPSLSSLESGQPRVSSVKGPVSIVRRRVSSCPAVDPGQNLEASLVNLVCSWPRNRRPPHRLVFGLRFAAHRLPPGTCTSGKIGAAQLR